MSQKALKFLNSLNYRMGHQDQIDFYQQVYTYLFSKWDTRSGPLPEYRAYIKCWKIFNFEAYGRNSS